MSKGPASENPASDDEAAKADALFHALADRTRRDILRRVMNGEHSVTSLAAKYDMSFAAVHKHVAVLERAGLITKRRQGREALATGDIDAVRSVASMLTELESLWRGRISRIDQLIAASNNLVADGNNLDRTTPRSRANPPGTRRPTHQEN